MAPTRAVAFDKTAPMIKFVSPSPASSNREEEIIDISRCIDEFKRQLTECGLQLDVLLEKKQIEDHWNMDGERELSDAWTEFTGFILLNDTRQCMARYVEACI